MEGNGSNVTKRRRLIEGFCLERCNSVDGECYCYKAKLEQRCQSCNQQVSLGHCIENHGQGWVHVRCQVDEERGLGRILQRFRQVDRAAIEDCTTSNVRRQLTYDEPTTEGILVRGQDLPISTWKRTRLEEEARCLEAGQGRHNSPTEEARKKAAIALVTPEKPPSTSLTKEQQAILDLNPQRGQMVHVNALAGCGKTTTIALLFNNFLERNPNAKMLYIVFGKKAQEEARDGAKFPKKGMMIQTSHAYAKQNYFGIDHMMKFVPQNEHDLKDICDFLNLKSEIRHYLQDLAAVLQEKQIDRIVRVISGYIRRTLRNFESSADSDVTLDHVWWRAKRPGMTGRSKWRNTIREGHYKNWASRYFFHCIVKKCQNVKELGRDESGITHDSYLKVAQLEGLEFRYDIVCIDEAQDMTPCQARLFWRHGGGADADLSMERNDISCIYYLFGDIWQQLYRFRGAGTSFKDDATNANYRMSLTGSFRFGTSIATTASSILEIVGGTHLIGRAVDPGEVHYDYPFEELLTHTQGTVVICRTNQGMMEFLLYHHPTRWTFLEPTKKVPSLKSKPWLSTLEAFIWEESISFSYRGESFQTREEIDEFIDDEDDIDLAKGVSLISMLKDSQKRVESFYEDLKNSYVEHKQEKGEKSFSSDAFNGIILTTAHGAKGMEFNNVFVYSDFKFDAISTASSGMSTTRIVDEVNILYVTVTRTMKRLYLSNEASKCLQQLAQQSSASDFISAKCLLNDRETWEAQWMKFQQQQHDKNVSISSLDDIPWPTTLSSELASSSSNNNEDASTLTTKTNPPSSSSFFLDRYMSDEEQKIYIRKMLLRFHTDKFLPQYRDQLKTTPMTLLQEIKDQLNHWQSRAREIYRFLQMGEVAP